MPVVCEQAGVWQQNLESTTIQGWLQADGPDNAQETPDGLRARASNRPRHKRATPR